MAMSLAENCYRVTKGFPREEIYGMTAQIRRASASIPANIADGYGRDQTGRFSQFLRIALLRSTPLSGLLDECESISRMLRSPIRSLEVPEPQLRPKLTNSPLTISPK